jgi:hypothetical protein
MTLVTEEVYQTRALNEHAGLQDDLRDMTPRERHRFIFSPHTPKSIRKRLLAIEACPGPGDRREP